MEKIKKLFGKIGAGAAGLLFQGATVQFTPLTSASNLGTGSTLSGIFTSNNLASFFSALFTFALSLGAILAVLRLAYAGWLYMGSDMWSKKEHAREVIGQAILGLLLLIGIYIILFQINPCILNLNILQDLQSQSTGATSCPSS